jgi:hypothetical protein
MMFSLLLLRRVYVKDVSLRVAFLEYGGINLINEFCGSSDVELISEILYNIDDLIYVELV